MSQVDFEIVALQNVGELTIHPFNPAQLNPASYNLRLSDSFCNARGQHLLPWSTSTERARKGNVGSIFTIHPGEFVLASTIEKIELSRRVAAEVKGRSSIGRLGIQVECAGWVDPGFGLAQITLEVKNISEEPVNLVVGMPICQIVFFYLGSRAKNPYEGVYRHQSGATPSKYKELIGRISSEKLQRWADHGEFPFTLDCLAVTLNEDGLENVDD